MEEFSAFSSGNRSFRLTDNIILCQRQPYKPTTSNKRFKKTNPFVIVVVERHGSLSIYIYTYLYRGLREYSFLIGRHVYVNTV